MNYLFSTKYSIKGIIIPGAMINAIYINNIIDKFNVIYTSPPFIERGPALSMPLLNKLKTISKPNKDEVALNKGLYIVPFKTLATTSNPTNKPM